MVTLVDLRAYWRFLRVTRQFLPLVIAYARDRRRFLLFGGRRQVSPERQRARAKRLLDSLLTLGPTFIKLGQLLSTRPDVLPPAYIEVLAQLQDDVPAADWAEAREVLEAELGPVEEVFDSFDSTPISGASLGQVYVAGHGDQQVAVKVRRPGVERLVEADLQAVRWALPLVLFFVDENRAFSMRNVADEFDETIREEMDYAREARMLTEIRENFADNPDVVIPEVVEEASTERVLTMEYVGGTKITRIRELDRRGIDRSALAETLQRAYLQMMIQDGVFHADPHPGNLAVTDDGRVVFYDFGMSGRVDPNLQDRIVDFYRAVSRRDIDAILDTLVAMGTLSPEADRGVMAEVMEVAIQDARGEDVDQYRIQQIVDQVENTIYEFPLRMPRDLALVLRVATVVEGVCVTLDEDFDFIDVATGYLREEGYFEETVRNRAREYGRELQSFAGAALRTPPKLEGAIDSLQRGNVEIKTNLNDPNDLLDLLAKRIVYGFLTAIAGLSTTLLYTADQFPAAAVAGVITVGVSYLCYRALRGPTGIKAAPQFTRQNLRERREQEGGVTATLATGPGVEEDDSESEPGSGAVDVGIDDRSGEAEPTDAGSEGPTVDGPEESPADRPAASDSSEGGAGTDGTDPDADRVVETDAAVDPSGRDGQDGRNRTDGDRPADEVGRADGSDGATAAPTGDGDRPPGSGDGVGPEDGTGDRSDGADGAGGPEDGPADGTDESDRGQARADGPPPESAENSENPGDDDRED